MVALLAVPVFENEDLANYAALVRRTALTVLALVSALCLSLMFALPANRQRWVGLALAYLAWTLVALAINRSGRPWHASLLLTVFSWSIMSVLAWTNGGLRSPAAFGYMVVVFIAGSLLGGVAGIYVGALCCLTGAAFAAAERLSLLSPSPVADTAFARWTAHIFIVAMAAGIQYLSSRSGKDTLDRVSSKLDNERRESEARFRTLFENAGDAILIIQGDRFFECNTRALEVFGCQSRDQIVGQSPGSLSPPLQPNGRNSHQLATERINAAADGRPQLFEWVHAKLDGTPFPAEVTLNAVELGGKVSLQAIVRDVSERKRTEEALRINERRLSLAVSATADAVWDWNLRTNETYYSPRWYHMLGYSSQQFTMHFNTWKDLCHPDDYQPTLDRIQAVLIGPQSSGYVAEFRMRKADGSWAWILGRGNVAERDAAGQPLLVSGTNTDITDRKRAEDQLRESEERYRNLFKNAPVGVFYSTSDGKVVRVNDEYARILGYASPEEAKEIVNQSTIAESVYVESQERASLVEAVVATPGNWIRTQRQLRRKDGSGITTNLTIRALPENPGDLEGFIEDITERKRAEEERERAFALLEASLEQSPSCIMIADAPNVTIRFANSAALRLRGATDQRLTGIDVSQHSSNWQVFRADGKPYPSEELPLSRAILKGETIQGDELIIRSAQGEDRWVTANAAPIRDRQGVIVSGIVIFHDITERKRADAVLRESEVRFRALFDLVPCTMAIHDLDGRLVDGNARLIGLCGRSREDIAGCLISDFFDIHHTGTREYDLARDVAVLHEALRRPVELTSVHRVTGARRIVLLSSVMIALDGKQRYLTCAFDVTEQRQIEQQFRQAQKMEAIGRLAGGVAHDFNNLLTVIGGYTQLALTHLTEKHRLYGSLLEVSKAAGRAASLTRQLLAFSRDQVLDPAVVDLNALVLDASKMLRRLIGEEVELDVSLGERLPSVRVDSGQTVQVLMNLAVNAGDAMPQGGRLVISTGTVEVGEERAEELGLRPGTHVSLRVTDTGTGMDQETQARIFEPFFTTKPVGHGTGLGLSTVFGIVKQSGGSITVSSRPGAGSVFEVLLPAVSPAEPICQEPQSEAVLGGTEIVLLAEDDKPIRELTRQILGRAGYVLLEAANGTDALTVARSHEGSIDLLVTDLKMPGISGLELARRLRLEFPDVAVLYVSGYSSGETLDGAQADDRAELIWKPFSPAILLKHVRRALDARRSRK
jgi:PAS domain S-box-containing protein